MRYLCKIALFSMMAIPLVSYASEINNVNISHVLVSGENGSGGNRVCVYPSEQIQGGPSCASKNRYCTDLNGPLGPGMLSIALTAHASKQLVKISGDGTCRIDSNSEDILYIFLKS